MDECSLPVSLRFASGSVNLPTPNAVLQWMSTIYKPEATKETLESTRCGIGSTGLNSRHSITSVSNAWLTLPVGQLSWTFQGCTANFRWLNLAWMYDKTSSANKPWMYSKPHVLQAKAVNFKTSTVCVWYQHQAGRASEKILLRGTKTDGYRVLLAFRSLVETCIACVYSNQNKLPC